MSADPIVRVFPDIIRHWAHTEPDRLALVDEDRCVTYGELHERTDAVAGALAASEMTAGANVGYLGKNTAAFWETWVGANKAGCALAPLNWRSPPAELTDLVDDAALDLLVLTAEMAEIAQAIQAKATRPLRLILVGQDSRAAPADGYETWLGGAHGSPTLAADPDATTLITYTSGTTGRPKGAELAHRAISALFSLSEQDPDMCWRPDDVALMTMPNFHLAGSWVPLPVFHQGGAIAIVGTFDPDRVLDAVARHRPTTGCLVPAAMQVLLDHPRTADTDFSCFDRLYYAGSPISGPTLLRSLETFGCDLVQFYGTTETYIISLLRPAQHDPDRPDLLHSCGTPINGVEVRMLDPQGKEVAPGEIGEVLVRSPLLFKGYWRQPDITAEVLQDGWYRTGDLGRADGDGNLYLVDRAKDMIITGGENVYSAEVERALQTHPAVAACGVVGEPDARWGERVVAFVMARPGVEVSEAGIIAHCRELIAGYKVPKVVHLVDDLPMTASGKVQKAVLRARQSGPRTPTEEESS